jgi:hypothetical protein
MYRLVTLLLLLATCLLAACNDSGSGANGQSDSHKVEQGGGSNLISTREIDSEPADSPQRALLEWFQAVQFEDVEGAQLLVAPRAFSRVNEKRFESAVRTVASALGKPTVIRVRKGKQTAAVRTLMQAFESGSSRPVSSDPESFPMATVDGEWRLDDLDYLFDAARSIDSIQ